MLSESMRAPTPAWGRMALGHAGAAPRATAIALPAHLTACPRRTAWVATVALHAAALMFLVASPPGASVPEVPPVRLVFVEPPPPPAAPLGTAAGAPPAVAEQLPDRAPQTRSIAKPTVAPKRVPLPRPASARKPKETAKVEPPPAAAEPVTALGTPMGSVAGVAGGVATGVVGGLPGGVPGGSGSAAIPAGNVAHPPQLIHRVAPLYSAEARRLDVSGLVVLEAILDREGKVESDVKILKSIPLLDKEAIAAVRQWRFRPARNDRGDAQRVILEIPIRFVLR